MADQRITILEKQHDELAGYVARCDALEAARKDALLQRLANAERYADLTGKSIAEAWDEVTPKNRHSETDWAKPVGREEW